MAVALLVEAEGRMVVGFYDVCDDRAERCTKVGGLQGDGWTRWDTGGGGGGRVGERYELECPTVLYI